MSFRRNSSFIKNDNKKIINLKNLIWKKKFPRNSNVVVHKRNESFSNSPKPVNSNLNENTEFLWNIELVLIYSERLIRQKIDNFNRVGLIQQFIQCSEFIANHLKESQIFVNNLSPDLPFIHHVKDSLENFKISYEGFFNWIESVSSEKEDFNANIGQDLFFSMQIKAQNFSDKLKSCLQNTNKDYKRSSIDNSSLISAGVRSLDSENSRKSCFNDEDRKLIDKLKKLEQNIDLPPPKPAVPNFDQDNLNNFLDQVEQVIKSQRESEYDYELLANNNELKSVKIENNCIMASSMISNDIPPVDMDSVDDCTPTPNVSDSLSNGFNFTNVEPDYWPVTEMSRNCPLPPIPGSKKMFLRCKLPQNLNSTFHSEEMHYRKTSMKDSDRSQVTNGSISNFNHRSPLRSPTLVASINLQNIRSPIKNLPLVPNHHHSNSSLQSPSTFSSNSEERTDFQGCNSSRHLLMAKQIPSVVDDPNDLLNINDMQNDIEIITRSFDAFNVNDKNSNRLSELSNQTNLSLQSDPLNQNSHSLKLVSNNDIYCNSEVKSDTEEYFEYFEIDGRKYRRKMKKRTVIEKIKIRKTVLAPLKPDGSGPDFSNLKIDDEHDDLLDTEPINNDHECLKTNNQLSIEAPQPRFRRGNEDRFRVSKSMFYPYRDQTKRATLCHPSNIKTDSNNKLYPLMNKYMYRFGESNFEEPVIDKRFSTQLTDAVYSTWIKTSESILPHEKSKSICYLKKSRHKNTDGATIHNAVRVTASRTVRMKVPDNDVNQRSSTLSSSIPGVVISNNTDEDESIIDGEDSDTSVCITDTSICGTDPRSSQLDSSLMSSDDEKDEDEESSFHSDSIISEHDLRQSKESAIEDMFFHVGIPENTEQSGSLSSDRNISPDSCYNSSRYSSNSLDAKEQHSFILTVNNATQYLIFDEDPKYGECDIAGGPVDALIVYACDGKEHLLFLGAFLDTYRTFIEPYELMSRLVIRYKFYYNEMVKNKERFFDDLTDFDEDPDKKCKHVLSLLLTIIGKLKHDLTDELNEKIQEFQGYLSEIKQTQWVEAISRAIKTQKQCMEKDDKLAAKIEQLSNQLFTQNEHKSPTKEIGSPTKSSMGLNSHKSAILNISSRILAEQMTLIDWCKYRKVELTELLNLKDIVNCNLPGVIEYAKNFENVQYWVQSILLDCDRVSDRDRLCVKFIRIMKHLQRLNNYSSLIAILLGIQLLPIEKMFSKRVRSKIKEYDNYMKPPRFTGYKEDLKHAVSPCIPFLGIFYQDIVMLNIANPPYLDLDEIIRNTDNNNFSSNTKQLLLSNSMNYGRIINFWRSFKQYIFLKNCNKDQDKIRYSIEPNEKVLNFLNNYRDSFDEITLQRLAKQLS